MSMTADEARDFLGKRHAWLCVTFPRAAEIPRERYVRRNLRAAMSLDPDAVASLTAHHAGKDGTEIYTR